MKRNKLISKQKLQKSKFQKNSTERQRKSMEPLIISAMVRWWHRMLIGKMLTRKLFKQMLILKQQILIAKIVNIKIYNQVCSVEAILIKHLLIMTESKRKLRSVHMLIGKLKQPRQNLIMVYLNKMHLERNKKIFRLKFLSWLITMNICL